MADDSTTPITPEVVSSESNAVVSLAEQIDCVQAELAKRRKAYPKWIEAKHISRDTAARELARMAAVLNTLIQLERLPDEQKLDAGIIDRKPKTRRAR